VGKSGIALAGALVAALMLSACGVSATTETVTVTAIGPAPSVAPATTTKTSDRTPTPRRRKRSVSASAGFTSCDANVRVKVGTTSCAFGQNVFYGFWKAEDEGDDTFKAYSPVSQALVRAGLRDRHDGRLPRR
jgi:hypothetical protein